MPLPGAWAPEVPCARCGARVAGLTWGERCPACRAERVRRANRIASRISLPATLLVGLYAGHRMPPTALARLYGVIVVVITYIAVRKIVQRVALELLRDEPIQGGRDD
jgi:hypothetical protein